MSVHAPYGRHSVLAMHHLVTHLIKHHVRATVATLKFAHKVATHPTTVRTAHIAAQTAHITYKAWFHGAKAAKHTMAFMVKVAGKGFKLRG